MTTVFHAWPYGRFIEIQSNLRRKKLHRTNQGSNFLGGSFSNRDNVRAPIQFRRESQPQHLKRWIFCWCILFQINVTKFKAYVCYFLSNLYFSPNDSPSKLWKFFLFHLKSSLLCWDIQFFVFLSSPLFPPVSYGFRLWSKINLKVHDIINCLNKKLTHFVWYLDNEKCHDIETVSLDRVWNKEHFHRKVMQKMCTKS